MSTNPQPASSLDADMRARIQESHDRAKFVLEASKLALDAQSQQLGKRGGPGRLDISNLFGHQSYTLPSLGTNDRAKSPMSPRPSFDPVHDDMQSTRKSIVPPPEDNTLTQSHMGRSSNRSRATITPHEMGNRSGARAVAANMNATNVSNMSVNDILAGSRSERVRRMSQAPLQEKKGAGSSRRQANATALAMFEQDENNFIAEIPAGFQPGSPPTCETPTKSEKQRRNNQLLYADNARIPIELDDFGGEGYLLRNDFSFNQMCNKQSNRTDSICLPLERNQGQSQQPQDSFFDTPLEITVESYKNKTPLRKTANNKIPSPEDSCKLRGGNLDGSVCMDCSIKSEQDSKKPACRSPKKECNNNKRQREKECKVKEEEPTCTIREKPCGSGLEILCVMEEKKPQIDTANTSRACAPKKEQQSTCNTTSTKKKNMDYCDQHLSYLDRVMKSLDLRSDSSCNAKSEVCDNTNNTRTTNTTNNKNNSNNNSCQETVQVVPARRAKSMMTVSDCCRETDGSKLSEASSLNSCCTNQDGFGGGGRCSGKPMSVCSQQFSNRDGDMRRANSQMSCASDFNFVNGYLPLKSTHNEISWPSVRLRKSVNRSFQIKNTSMKRLIIRVILDGPGFNFENPEANAKGTMTLQPNEVRTLVLIFNPTVLGPAIGNLIFQPPIEYCAAGGGCATMSNINSPVTKRVIRLYGYGGHVAMSMERLQQGPVGTKFLPLGNLCNLNKVFEESFIIRNKGNLTGFAAVMLENKTVGKSLFDKAISVCPDKVLVPPNTAVKIKVSFQPTNTDMREMMKIHREQEVIAIGNILVVTGDEPTRCRMKRLISNSEELSEKYSSAQLRNIWADYGRNDCDYDLTELRETGLAVADLMSSFQSKEVALTVNNSTTDMSLIDASGWISEIEDSDALFHTICQPNENSECCHSPPNGDVNMMPLQSMQVEQEEDPCNPDEWQVNPQSLTFITNSVLPQVLTIQSRVSKDRMFEVDSNVANYFCVSPQEGVITPSCNTTNISVRMMNYNVPNCPMYIYIYIENDRICVPVNVERGPPEGKATCAQISNEKIGNLS